MDPLSRAVKERNVVSHLIIVLSKQFTWEDLSEEVQNAVRDLGIWPRAWAEHEDDE
jgi:hypothetical protein